MHLLRRIFSLTLGLTALFCGGIIASRVVANELVLTLDLAHVGNLELTVAGLIATLTGLLGVWAALSRRGSAPRGFLLPITDSTQLRLSITAQSLKSAVDIVCRAFPDVRGCDVEVDLKEDGWRVQCDLKTAPGTPLPKVSRDIDSTLRESLKKATGVPVSVLVLNFDDLAPQRARRVA